MLSGPNACVIGVRMNRTWLICLALGPIAAGCASTAKVRTAQVTPPAAYQATQPNPDGLQPAALDAWWTLFNDAQLNTLVDQALANSPDTRDALAKLQQALAIRDQSRAQIFLPSGNPSASGTRTDTDVLSGITIPGFSQAGISNSLSASFDVSWELDLFGRRGAQNAAASADFHTAAFTYEATRTALIASVAQSLFDARGLALQLEDAQRTSEIDRDLLRVAQVKFDHGLSPCRANCFDAGPTCARRNGGSPRPPGP